MYLHGVDANLRPRIKHQAFLLCAYQVGMRRSSVKTFRAPGGFLAALPLLGGLIRHHTIMKSGIDRKRRAYEEIQSNDVRPYRKGLKRLRYYPYRETVSSKLGLDNKRRLYRWSINAIRLIDPPWGNVHTFPHIWRP